MKIAVLVSFLAVLIIFFFVTQVPITLTANEVAKAVSEATSESGVSVDEDVLEKAVQLSVAKLEKRTKQTTEISRLRISRYLVGICSLCSATRSATAGTRQTPRPTRTRF